MLNKAMRAVMTVGGLALGYAFVLYSLPYLTELVGYQVTMVSVGGLLGVGALLGGIIGFILAPKTTVLLWQVTVWIETRLQRAPMQDIIAGAIGLILGLIIANLLGSAFARLPWVGVILSPLGSIILGYLGISIALHKREEISHFLTGFSLFGGRERQSRQESKPVCKILDTSVIIDGRVADICKSGFIEGTIIIPGFVLDELRHIADSSDLLKRNRGRRGLDILNKIQKELDVPVQIYEKSVGENLEVDSKLVKLAKTLGGKVLTNDYNLNKVAELQGITVLNINELANAVKPVVLPGEEMAVHVIKDGKEAGQGVAYLDDGTMIVVDGGKKHIGDTIDVMVTSVLQTAAGRMIFAKPKTASLDRTLS